MQCMYTQEYLTTCRPADVTSDGQKGGGALFSVWVEG